jgi:hypothetical protein
MNSTILGTKSQDADQQDGIRTTQRAGSDRSHWRAPVRSSDRFKRPAVATMYYLRRAIRVPRLARKDGLATGLSTLR